MLPNFYEKVDNQFKRKKLASSETICNGVYYSLKYDMDLYSDVGAYSAQEEVWNTGYSFILKFGYNLAN